MCTSQLKKAFCQPDPGQNELCCSPRAVMSLGREGSKQYSASASLWLLGRWEECHVEGGCVVPGLREGKLM